MQIGAAIGQFNNAPVKGNYVKINNEDFYKSATTTRCRLFYERREQLRSLVVYFQ